MKKTIILALMILPLLTGCFVYADGKHTGYVEAVDNDVFWSKVWFKTSLDASTADCYIVERKSPLSMELQQMAEQAKRITIQYDQHLFTATLDCSDEQIVSYKILGELE